jgi:hypothetical protein
MALTLSGDDGVAGVNGSATTPAIQGTDTNTGLTFGTDTVNIVTGGSERFKIGSAGQLGIGGATYGTSGQVLTSGGSSAAPTWGGAGKILQVVSGSASTAVSYTSSSTWTDSGLSASITPSATSSKVLILIDVCILVFRTGDGDVGSGLKIERGSTPIFTTPNDYGIYINAAASGGVDSSQRAALNVLDEPESISELTYTLYGKNYNQGTSRFQPGANQSHMILMEVAA